MNIFVKLAAPALALLASCQQSAVPGMERPVQIDTMLLVAPPAQSAVKVASNEVSVVSHDSTTYIRFGDCYLSLDWISPDHARNDFELRPDTLFFTLRRHHTIEGQMLAITTRETEKIKVSQSYETSIVIGTVALKNWKHYRAGWEMLTAEANNFFICKRYTLQERTLFPAFSLPALQQYVKKNYSKDVYARIAHTEKIPQATISTYYLKLNSLSKRTAARINKLLVIEVAF
ncbi:hypothetical protein [Chitinophaga sp. MM2321]|uniref:hypothetical protein n=1 Tax=Chitinophaga sp. MM2321 TaxID=3137178 RepID=UPI0032D57F00